MSASSPRPSSCRGSFARRMARHASVLLCALLAGSGAIELHNQANHHRAIELGSLVEVAASHPRIPHHFDRSEELREPACATCALQAQARGVQPTTATPQTPSTCRRLESSAELLPALAKLPASASPRGPPAA